MVASVDSTEKTQEIPLPKLESRPLKCGKIRLLFIRMQIWGAGMVRVNF